MRGGKCEPGERGCSPDWCVTHEQSIWHCVAEIREVPFDVDTGSSMKDVRCRRCSGKGRVRDKVTGRLVGCRACRGTGIRT